MKVLSLPSLIDILFVWHDLSLGLHAVQHAVEGSIPSFDHSNYYQDGAAARYVKDYQKIFTDVMRDDPSSRKSPYTWLGKRPQLMKKKSEELFLNWVNRLSWAPYMVSRWLETKKVITLHPDIDLTVDFSQKPVSFRQLPYDSFVLNFETPLQTDYKGKYEGANFRSLIVVRLSEKNFAWLAISDSFEIYSEKDRSFLLRFLKRPNSASRVTKKKVAEVVLNYSKEADQTSPVIGAIFDVDTGDLMRSDGAEYLIHPNGERFLGRISNILRGVLFYISQNKVKLVGPDLVEKDTRRSYSRRRRQVSTFEVPINSVLFVTDEDETSFQKRISGGGWEHDYHVRRGHWRTYVKDGVVSRVWIDPVEVRPDKKVQGVHGAGMQLRNKK